MSVETVTLAEIVGFEIMEKLTIGVAAPQPARDAAHTVGHIPIPYCSIGTVAVATGSS
jgi:hypothetical protein